MTFTGHELEGDGTDPQTELAYPVADADRMNRLAWIAERLPGMTTVNLADLDWQQTVMDMLNSGSLKPNLRKLMKDYDNADEDERKAVAKRLKPEFWSGVEQAPAAPAQRQPVAVQEIGKLPDAMDERPAPPPPQVIEGPRPVHMPESAWCAPLGPIVQVASWMRIWTDRPPSATTRDGAAWTRRHPDGQDPRLRDPGAAAQRHPRLQQ